jgi:hypothetical protein
MRDENGDEYIYILLIHITKWLYIGKVEIQYKTSIKHRLLIHLCHYNTRFVIVKEYTNFVYK